MVAFGNGKYTKYFSFINIYFTVFLLSIEAAKSCLQECSLIQLQKHIQTSRHIPVCVIFSRHGMENTLRKTLCMLIKHKGASEIYASWTFDLFYLDQVGTSPIQIPDSVPTLRCYMLPTEWQEYNGTSNKKSIHHWLQKQVSAHNKLLPEATTRVVAQSLIDHSLTAIGFYLYQQHSYIEQLLSEVQETWKRKVNIIMSHPESADMRSLATRYAIKQSPSLVFIEGSVNMHREPVVREVLGPLQVTKQHIDLLMMIRELEVITLSSVNFNEVVLTKTKHYIPILVLFYIRTSPLTLDYLRAFVNVKKDMVEYGVNIRFGVMEVNNSVTHVFQKAVKAAYTTGFPLTVLFAARWNKTTVVSIDEIVISERPTLATFLEALTNHGFILKAKDGLVINANPPWGHYDRTQMTELFEGPNGLACTIYSSNLTDNTPVVWTKIKHQKSTKESREFIFHQYADHEENISLQYVGAIPLVTSDIWHTLIERSYYRLEPHTNDGTWRRQDTKVILVIFVLAGCGSCVKNHHVFEQIQTSVDHINGAAVYMVNCSRDAQLCKNQNISGFPTVVAYRGLNWLDSDQCLSEGSSTSQTYVRIDYHGVLTVHQVMAWFSEVTSGAVVNLQFAHRANNSKLSVQLTATVLPRQSRYLPHIPGKHAEYFYPFKCYRLACEYLYGQAACYTQYSDDVPKSEYSSDSHDLIVTKIVLSRNDGIRTTIMQLGRTLYNTFEEESSTGIHSFHRPHRYKLHHQQRCEDDHRSCTDLIIHFVRDHGRLPITHMTSQAFHMPHNLLFQDNLPVLVALVHQENITQESEFYQVLLSIAYQFYKEVIVVSVDVDEFPGWSGQFVPHGARHKFKENESHSFYTYPRLCVVRWNDHRHAAFFPPTKAAPTEDTATIEIDGFLITDKARVARATAESKDGDEAGSNPSKDRSSKTYKRSNDVLNRTAVENFLRQYLANPDQFITETEHF